MAQKVEVKQKTIRRNTGCDRSYVLLKIPTIILASSLFLFFLFSDQPYGKVVFMCIRGED